MFDNETTVPGIDAETFDQFVKLLDVPKPGEDAYHDGDPVTVNLTKGQAFELRGALRWRIHDVLDQIEVAESYGVTPTDAQVEDLNRYMAVIVVIDGQLASVADTAEYPAEVEEQEPALV